MIVVPMAPNGCKPLQLVPIGSNQFHFQVNGELAGDAFHFGIPLSEATCLRFR